MHAMVGHLRVEFSRHADQDKASAMSAYMKGHFPFLGLQKPLRSELQKPFISKAREVPIESCHLITQELWVQPEREYQYVAMDLLLSFKMKWNEETFELAEKLIVTKSWWDTVDILAARLAGHFLSKYPDRYRSRILSYSLSEDLWLNRTALISQLFAKEKTDTTLLVSAFHNCQHKKDFFIQKAIGWALRQYSMTDPDFVRSLTKSHSLTRLAEREALKKINGT